MVVHGKERHMFGDSFCDCEVQEGVSGWCVNGWVRGEREEFLDMEFMETWREGREACVGWDSGLDI